MTLGENIKKFRNKINMTQLDLSELIKKSTRTIQKYESGEITPPIDVISELCDIFGITVGELLTSVTTVDRVTRNRLMLDPAYANIPKPSKDDFTKRIVNFLRGRYEENPNDLKAELVIDIYDSSNKLSDKHFGELSEYYRFVKGVNELGFDGLFPIPLFSEFNFYIGIQDILKNKGIELEHQYYSIDDLFQKLKLFLDFELYKLKEGH